MVVEPILIARSQVLPARERGRRAIRHLENAKRWIVDVPLTAARQDALILSADLVACGHIEDTLRTCSPFNLTPENSDRSRSHALGFRRLRFARVIAKLPEQVRAFGTNQD